MIPLEGARIDARTKDKAKFLQDKKRYADVEYVHMRSVAEAQQDGLLSFKVPGKNRKLRARAVDIRAESTQDYEWNGEFDDFYGFMNVVSVKGQIRAHVSYDGDEYDIYPLEDGVHAVAKLLPPDSTFQGGCGMDAILASPADSSDYQYEHEHDEQGSIGSESSREISCVERTVRVLVLHTARARGTNINPQTEAQLHINNFNQAETNSLAAGTLGRLELAGVVPYNLPNGNERQFRIIDDINDMIDDTRAGGAQDLRDQFNADLVVLFTEGNYEDPDTRGRIFGAAGNFNPATRDIQLIDARSYAIVDIQDAGNNLTFVHEVGHMFGMRHQTCAEWDSGFGGCDNGGAFEHGYNFRRPGALFRRERRYRTIMHQVRGDDWNQILHFSNPDVIVNTQASGFAGIADNTRQLEVAAPTVSRYELRGNLTASIDGPSSVNVFSTNTWEAVYSCGVGYTFRWEVSNDGFIFNFAGSGEILTYGSSSNISLFYIRLIVTSNNGQVVRTFRTINVNNFRTQDAMASKDTANWQQVMEQTTEAKGGIVLKEAYPNAMREATQVGFYLPKAQTVSLDIVNLNGQWVRNVADGAMEVGYHELIIKREGLAPGLYLYRLSVGDQQYNRRLLVGD